MNVGDYVRTRDGLDRLVSKIKDDNYDYYWYRFGNGKTMTNPENGFVKKSSSNIIDLIEVGDYVNCMLVTNIWIDKETGNIEFEFNNHESYLYPKSWNYESGITKYKIKSIVTKECFESMEYKVGEQ